MARSCHEACLGTAASVLLLLTFTLAALGCGPIQSTSTIHDATVAVEAARVMDAELYAPYEYTMAVNMLHKAKEEWGYSDFEAAIDFAAAALEHAEEARKIAKDSPLRGKPVQDNPTDE